MSYLSTKDISAKVRNELKRVLPDWKFSVQMKSFAGGSSITLALMSGPEEVMGEWPEGSNGREWGSARPGYAQLNPISFGSQGRFYGKDELISNGYQLTPKGWEVMEIATKILSADHWDKSDVMSDYFSCNFYMHVDIGKWDRNYEIRN